MDFKILYLKSTGEVIGIGEFAETDTHGVIDIPDGFAYAESIKWRYDNAAGKVILKTGQEFADALAVLAMRTKAGLVRKYAGEFVSPVIQGSMEAATDLVIQMVHKWVNGVKPSQAEIDAWNAFIKTCAPHYKLTLVDADQDEFDSMAKKKAAARKAEADMYKDPSWPSKRRER